MGQFAMDGTSEEVAGFVAVISLGAVVGSGSVFSGVGVTTPDDVRLQARLESKRTEITLNFLRSILSSLINLIHFLIFNTSKIPINRARRCNGRCCP